MKPELYPRSGTQTLSRKPKRFLPTRLLSVVAFFALAFTVDMLTGQHYSPFLGSAAIIASVLVIFPAWLSTVFAFAGYGAIWLGFNLVRAVADDAGLSVADPLTVSNAERALFGDSLPSQILQGWFYDPHHLHWWDASLAVVHVSFFIIPFAMAITLFVLQRTAFLQYSVATAICFGLGIIGFLLLPTAPPWMSDAPTVERITHHIVFTRGDAATSEPGFSFEPNHLAAMPSIHVGAAVLVWLASRTFGRKTGWCGLLYAVAMSVSVVYLGEHFLLDVIGGWIVALSGWQVAIALRTRPPE